MNATIRLAEARDLDQLAELFDQYRQFYECPPDLSAAKNWIAENLERGRSTIFTADDGCWKLELPNQLIFLCC